MKVHGEEFLSKDLTGWDVGWVMWNCVMGWRFLTENRRR
jgi:hypothetical protein